MRHHRLLLLFSSICLIVTVAALPFISGCGEQAPSPAPAPAPAPSAEPIKIGALSCFTGPYADYGPYFQEAMEWLLEQNNYEVAGRPIELIIEDSASDTSISLEKAKKLVTVDNVKVILGPLHSGVASGIGPYLAENKILMVPFMTKPLEVGNFGNVISPYGTLYSDGMVVGWYAYDELGYRTINTVAADFIAGKRFANGCADMFVEKGGTLVQQQWPPIGCADYGPYLTAIKDADVIGFWGSPGEQLRFMTQSREFGLKIPTIFISFDQNREIVIKDSPDLFLDKIGEATWTSTIDNPACKKLMDDFHAKFGQDRNLERDFHSAYVALALVIDGLKATGGDDSFDKLYPAILNLDLDYPQGHISFDSSGHAIIDRHIVQAKNINGRYLLDVIKTYPAVRDPRL